MKSDFFFLSSDGRTQIHVIEWVPETPVQAILQMTHGMKEYIDRYDDFARYLNQFGIYVVGQDHLGHGKSVLENRHGFFHESQGNECLMNDMRTLHQKTMEKFPKTPYFLLGHSMGSFLVRQYIGYYGRDLDGTIIMGTGEQPDALVKIGLKILEKMVKRHGPYYVNHQVDRLLSHVFNRRFEPVETVADWISKDRAQVKKYVEHEWCTFDFTISAYRELLKSIERMNDKKTLRAIPKTLPILLVSGQDDPVGDFGKAVANVFEKYKQLGIKDVRLKLYPNDRHEILNETDRLVVYEDIYQWLEIHIKKER